ncbi:MAG: cobalamin B12-binding domain-containing protein [Candidatus Zhuqueibacterota bacterium]
MANDGNQLYDEISACLRKGNSSAIRELIESGLKDRQKPLDLLYHGLIPGMKEISMLFKENEIYVPEVLVAASAMHAGLDVLRPLLTKSEKKLFKRVVIGTVKGDLHNIGKNLVIIMLEGAGFEVIDLGVDIAPEKFVEKAIEYSPHILALSALLTTTMPMMKITLEALRVAGIRKKVKVLIGGAPITARFAQLIKADGYADDAVSAVQVARDLLKLNDAN